MHSHDLGLLRRAVTSNRGDCCRKIFTRSGRWSGARCFRRGYRHAGQTGEASLAAGQLADAANSFRQVLARDPARESAHRGLMRVYAAQGSQRAPSASISDVSRC